MFKCIGKYGEYNRYEINLGESETIDDLLNKVIHRINSLKPEERVCFYVFKENQKIGRFMRVDIDGYGLQYVPNEEVNEFVENKRKRYGLTSK